MEPNQIDTYNISSNVLNNLAVSVDTSLSSASNCFIETLNVNSITSSGTYDYYTSRGNEVQIGDISHPDRNNEFIDELRNFKWEMYFPYDDGQVHFKTNRKRITLQFNFN